MASTPIQMPRVTERLKPGVDEMKSHWVVFPDQKLYLLPVLARSQKIVPRFTADGVLLEMQVEDRELMLLVEKLLELARTIENGEVWLRTEDSIRDFFSLLRRLILTNYDFTDDELSVILSVTSHQMQVLFDAALGVVLRG